MPSTYGGDNFIGVGGPDEGFRLHIVLFQEAVDRSLEIEDRMEHAPFQSPFRERAKNPSTAFSHEHEVGVKWNVNRSWRSSTGGPLDACALRGCRGSHEPPCSQEPPPR